jgi:DNA polymerase
MGGHAYKFYGGKLTENEIQATARDVLCDAWVKLDEAGFRVLFTVYDEFVIELPWEGFATRARIREAISIITGSSPWLEDCPLGCEWELSKHYKK